MQVYAVRARLVVGCVLLAALAGCGGDPPAPPPFTPATSSTSPTPTGPVEPVLPEAATEPTEAGAKAFAEFYWQDVVSYAQATGDTRLLRRLSAVTCYQCDAGADALEDIYERGGAIRGGDPTISRLGAHLVGSSPARFSVTFRLENSPQEIDFPGTEKDSKLGAAARRIDLRVDFLDGAWIVSGWSRL